MQFCFLHISVTIALGIVVQAIPIPSSLVPRLDPALPSLLKQKPQNIVDNPLKDVAAQVSGKVPQVLGGPAIQELQNTYSQTLTNFTAAVEDKIKLERGVWDLEVKRHKAFLDIKHHKASSEVSNQQLYLAKGAELEEPHRSAIQEKRTAKWKVGSQLKVIRAARKSCGLAAKALDAATSTQCSALLLTPNPPADVTIEHLEATHNANLSTYNAAKLEEADHLPIFECLFTQHLDAAMATSPTLLQRLLPISPSHNKHPRWNSKLRNAAQEIAYANYRQALGEYSVHASNTIFAKLAANKSREALDDARKAQNPANPPEL